MGILTILLLGCHIDYIQNDRISTAINFINTQYKNFDVNWVLTGGIKYEIPKIIQQPESIEMANYFKDYLEKNNINNLKWKFILDSDAENTAENFGNFKKLLEDINNDNNMIYIVTSEFHKKRANTILNGIIPNNNFKWILSKKKCNYCDHNEEIHSKNIKKDIKMGLQKYNQIK